MTPTEVDELFKSPSPVGETDVRAWRIGKLRQVLGAARDLLESGSPDLVLVAQKIGDGSRDSAWRVPLGQSGVLEFFISLICMPGIRHAVAVQTLRVIGNSCADTDENRALVVAADCFPKLVKLINDDSVLMFAATVLLNLCLEYEPAQIAAYKSGLNPALVNLISGPRLDEAVPVMSIICQLLVLIANQEPEANLVHPATPYVMLNLALRPDSLDDLEEFLSRSSVALAYLSNPKFQDSFLRTPEAATTFVQVFSQACLHYNISELEADDAERLDSVCSMFIQALADLSADPLFSDQYQIRSDEFKTLERWVTTNNNSLRTAACLALGNLARSDEICVALVEQSGIHKALTRILSDALIVDAQLTHSVLGFARNLAIPVSNKPVLGEGGLFEADALPRIWGLDTQVQVQFAAVSLARLLLVSCSENVERVCETKADGQTLFASLIGLFKRSDQEPTKAEASRAVASVLRTLHSAAGERSSILGVVQEAVTSSPNQGVPRFYDAHDGIAEALVYLGSQPKFPALRSELWFLLALMSRSRSSSAVVATILGNSEVLQALYETVTGETRDPAHDYQASTDASAMDSAEFPGSFIGHEREVRDQSRSEEVGASYGLEKLDLEPQQADSKGNADIARVDRENGLILVSGILHQNPPELSEPLRATLKGMLQDGGQKVLEARQGGMN